MTATLHQRPARELDTEYRAAIARLDADLQIVVRAARDGSPDTLNMLALLRRRVVDTYRTALGAAAGRPDDAIWQTLTVTAAAFVARIPRAALSGEAYRAAVRLDALAREGD